MLVFTKKYLLTASLLLLTFCGFAQYSIGESSAQQERWVDSVFQKLDVNQRLGQLFMIRAHSDKGSEHINDVKRQVKEYGVGGLCFFQGTPEKQAKLTNDYQAIAKVPLMISMDAEWGLGMRMKKSTISFPRQMALGAIEDNRLIYDMGKEVARQLRRLGVHVNFAPVVDVNNNPKNPVINTRSFGENRLNVAVKSYMYSQGMQDFGVMACAKHFPGHGDTDVDSHYDLPIITHDRKRLDSIELFPFKVLSRFGVGSVMVAHLHVPILDATKHLPTTLSRKVISTLLKKELQFKGLVFTDALEMKGVTKHFPPGEIEVKALEAGVDVLLMPEDVNKAVSSVKAAFASGRLDSVQIYDRVKKVLRSKYQLQLTERQRISEENIREDLNSNEARALKRKLIQNSMTLAVDEGRLVPFTKLDQKKFASISLGTNSKTTFQKTLEKYKKMTHYQIKEVSAGDLDQKRRQLKDKDVIIIGLHDMSSYAKKDFGLSPNEISFVNKLAMEKEVVLTVFGSPYSLLNFNKQKHVLVAYSEDEDTQELAAQALFGVYGIKGKLPVSASSKYESNMGVSTNKIFRLGYGIPEEVGIDSRKLLKIDTIARKAISRKATPGCVVLVAKNGKVVFNKAYGNHTFSKSSFAMQTDDLFDVASVTKVAATTISLMKLQDEGKFSVYNFLGDYVSSLKLTNKENLVVEDVLAHHSGMKSWLPFYKSTLTKHKKRRYRKPQKSLYQAARSDKFSTPVAKDLFLRSNYDTAIWSEIKASEVFETKKYRYSDLGFYIMAEVVKQKSGKSLNEFVEANFYQSLGLSKTLFNPWEKHSIQTIVPSEEDKYFRHKRVQGYVHDMGAAMLGGVSGHAGLFSTSNDLAILMQMLLNEGYYGGERFLSPEVIRQYTTRHHASTRRGMGFDMKELNPSKKQNLPKAASPNTFGHIGFTGTCVWADPDNQLIYVFLSNRTYPSMRNYKINDLNTRGRIHAAIYDAFSANGEIAP